MTVYPLQSTSTSSISQSPSIIGASNEHRRCIAIATASGTHVDQHFASAEQFHIYDLEDTAWSFIEIRKNSESHCGCTAGSSCAPEIFTHILSLLADVNLVVVSRIGADAAAALLEHGIRGHLSTGPIETVLNDLRSSPKLRFSLRSKGFKT